jgi:hypothetical protein
MKRVTSPFVRFIDTLRNKIVASFISQGAEKQNENL